MKCYVIRLMKCFILAVCIRCLREINMKIKSTTARARRSYLPPPCMSLHDYRNMLIINILQLNDMARTVPIDKIPELWMTNKAFRMRFERVAVMAYNIGYEADALALMPWCRADIHIFAKHKIEQYESYHNKIHTRDISKALARPAGRATAGKNTRKG